jgi:hypothetical protein
LGATGGVCLRESMCLAYLGIECSVSSNSDSSDTVASR